MAKTRIGLDVGSTAARAVEINVAFWLENIDRLTERFNKWATK